MLIQVSPHGSLGSEALSAHVQREVRRAVRSFENRVTRVEVHFHDDNGPAAHGHDKRVVIEARLAGRQPFAVAQSSDDLYGAITEAARKLRRTGMRLMDIDQHRH
ncbi:MAG: HPF/RaiA family ribosome-associated protein [Phycisphaeraceae bacterium]|nr:HPF/RaiA family ribosome-associated protein [Phycisphaeraceae bacterium]